VTFCGVTFCSCWRFVTGVVLYGNPFWGNVFVGWHFVWYLSNHILPDYKLFLFNHKEKLYWTPECASTKEFWGILERKAPCHLHKKNRFWGKPGQWPETRRWLMGVNMRFYYIHFTCIRRHFLFLTSIYFPRLFFTCFMDFIVFKLLQPLRVQTTILCFSR
jgi:hypothetical protein